ncbi:MAG: hypothetical protein IPL46_12755 [Saprospiraceae bacterium]|nr:hypothetical protein [Saprospiraceae bacterium]
MHQLEKLSAGVPEITIQLEKSGCFGHCPVYVLTIYSDKTISFEGKANTLMDGNQKDTLTQEKYAQIINMFDHEQFAELDSTYIENIVDAPFTYLSFRQKGKLKKISVRGSAPDSFKRLADQVEDIARKAHWLESDTEGQNSAREMIIELRPEIDPEVFSHLFVDDNLTLIKKITPNQHYYLFSIESNDPEALLIKIRNEPQVKNAQWNHKLSKREK